MRISKSFGRIGPSFAVVSIACAFACSSSTPNKAKPGEKPDATGGWNAAAEWKMMGYENGSTYWNKAETKITVASVANLDKAWEFDTKTVDPAGAGFGVTATPVVVGGVVYLASQGLFARDLATGNEVWSNPALSGGSSLAYADHVLYLHDSAGTVHAVSDADGKEIWNVATDTQAGLVGFSSPILTKDLVIIGGSTLEEIAPPAGGATFRGFIEAINKSDGKIAWQKYTVEEPAHGATLWSSVSVDEGAGMVYAATGNNHGAPATDTSDGFLAFPLAGPATADFAWKAQIFAGDIWMLSGAALASPDNDFGANPIVFDLNGQKLVAGGNKGGDFWVLDRTNGTVIKKRNLGPHNAAKGGIFISGTWDGKRLLAACNGRTSMGAGSDTSGSSPSTLLALDPLTLDIQWERQVPGPVFSTISVANGVGFFGKNTILQAFNTETGEVLKEFTTEGTIATSPSISNGYVVFGSGMSWPSGGATSGTKYYALKVP